VTDTHPRRPGPLTFLLAALAAVLAAGVTGLAVRGGATTFTSTALLTIDQPQAVAAAGDGGVLDKLSKLRFKYVGLVPTDRLAEPVAARLKVPVGSVRGHLAAFIRPTDLLLRVSCSETTAEPARTCADALGASLVAYVVKEQTPIPPAQRIVMTQVQPAGFPARTGPHRSRSVGLAALAAALAAAVVLGVAARPRR
jgi:hypothetical protein